MMKHPHAGNDIDATIWQFSALCVRLKKENISAGILIFSVLPAIFDEDRADIDADSQCCLHLCGL